MKKLFFLSLMMMFFVTLFSPFVFGQEQARVGSAVVEKTEKSQSNIGMKAIAAAIAVGLSAIASGLAQARIGAAGAGALAEKPEVAGSIIILEAIPETMIILGFVIAVLIIFIL